MKLRKLFLSAVLASAGVALLASPAAAHAVTVQGSTVCSDGEYVVTWRIHNSEPYKRMVTTIATNVGESSPQGLTVPAPTGTGTVRTIVDGDFSGTVTLTATANWYDGNGTQTSGHFGPRTASASVRLVGDCAPPPPPPPPTTTTTQPPPPPPTVPPTVPPTTPAQPPAVPPSTQPPTTPAKPCDSSEATEDASDDCALPHTGSSDRPLFLIGAGAALVGVALAARPRRRAA